MTSSLYVDVENVTDVEHAVLFDRPNLLEQLCACTYMSCNQWVSKYVLYDFCHKHETDYI